jgi:hypothetical protein
VYSEGNLFGQVEAQPQLAGNGGQRVSSAHHGFNVRLDLIKIQGWIFVKCRKDEFGFIS